MSATGLPNDLLDLGLGDGGVLHHVVQQRGGEPLRVEPPLRQDARDRERVRDVRLARLAELPAVRGLGELERALDERDVRRRQVVPEVLRVNSAISDMPLQVGAEPGDGQPVARRRQRRPGLQQHFDADLAGGDFAQRDDGRLVAVGVDQRRDAGA